MSTQSLTVTGGDIKYLLWALLISLAIAAAWVGLTMQTGLTYHLMPGVVAAAPGFFLAWSPARPGSRALVMSTFFTGLAVAAGGWLTLELTHSMPSATFFKGQPGGVPGEIVLFALAGAIFGARSFSRSTPDDTTQD